MSRVGFVTRYVIGLLYVPCVQLSPEVQLTQAHVNLPSPPSTHSPPFRHMHGGGGVDARLHALIKQAYLLSIIITSIRQHYISNLYPTFKQH